MRTFNIIQSRTPNTKQHQQTRYLQNNYLQESPPTTSHQKPMGFSEFNDYIDTLLSGSAIMPPSPVF